MTQIGRVSLALALAEQWAERRDGVSETNPDKHGRAFHDSASLCLCVKISMTKGRLKT